MQISAEEARFSFWRGFWTVKDLRRIGAPTHSLLRALKIVSPAVVALAILTLLGTLFGTGVLRWLMG